MKRKRKEKTMRGEHRGAREKAVKIGRREKTGVGKSREWEEYSMLGY